MCTSMCAFREGNHVGKENLEEYAYNAIVKLIQANHFKPGDFLLETELSDLFGLKSRTPVRHALGQLVAKGFLEKKKKKGCFIPPTSVEDAQQVFHAREIVESSSALLAARHATPEDIAQLRAIVQLEAATGESGNKFDYSRLNEKFHAAVARTGRNAYLERYSEHLFWRSTVYVFLFGGYYTQPDFVQHMLAPPQHMGIVEAIASHAAETARDLMAHHIRFTFDRIFNLI
jgi:DNA-binding GntR family transcriptional regulator